MRLAQPVPCNYASNSDDQKGEQDAMALSHGGIMNRMQQKSRTLRCCRSYSTGVRF